MKTVRISGVPEHFNLPWQMAIEAGAFEERGINLVWSDVPEGTGKMCQQLEEGEAELAVLLTEGIVKSIAGGNTARIVQQYIGSPLIWGVHVSAGSHHSSLESLKDGIAAISRAGSGSHLMAFLHARDMGWDTLNLKFEVVHNLEGAVTALENGAADYFMWEHYTTKPLVDSNIFRRLSDYPTPWPCFVIAAGNDFLQKMPGALSDILEVINSYSADFRHIPSIDKTLAHRYGQQLNDIRDWLDSTSWSQDQLTTGIIDNVQDTLFKLKLIKDILPAQDFLCRT